MDPTEKLKQKSFFNLWMAKNWREQTLTEVIIKSWIGFHFLNLSNLLLCQSWINFGQKILICKLRLLILHFHHHNLFLFFIFLNILWKLIVFNPNMNSYEDKFIIQFSYTFKPCYTLNLSHISSSVCIFCC